MLSTMNCNNLNAGGLFEICTSVLCLPVCRVAVMTFQVFCLKLFLWIGELVTAEMQLTFDVLRRNHGTYERVATQCLAWCGERKILGLTVIGEDKNMVARPHPVA